MEDTHRPTSQSLEQECNRRTDASQKRKKPTNHFRQHPRIAQREAFKKTIYSNSIEHRSQTKERQEEEMIPAISNTFTNFCFRNHSRRTLKKIRMIALNTFLNANVATISYMTARYVTAPYLTGILLTVSVISSAVFMAHIKC